MKRITNRKLRIAMTLKVYKNDRLVSRVTKQKKSQIFRVIESISFTEPNIKVFVRVNYGTAQNESYHTNKNSLIKALNDYTEKPLIDFILQQ